VGLRDTVGARIDAGSIVGINRDWKSSAAELESTAEFT